MLFDGGLLSNHPLNGRRFLILKYSIRVMLQTFQSFTNIRLRQLKHLPRAAMGYRDIAKAERLLLRPAPPPKILKAPSEYFGCNVRFCITPKCINRLTTPSSSAFPFPN